MKNNLCSLAACAAVMFSGHVFAHEKMLPQEFEPESLESMAKHLSDGTQESFEEELRQLKIQDAIVEMDWDPEHEFQDRFAGTYMDHARGRLMVRLTGNSHVDTRWHAVDNHLFAIEFLVGQKHTKKQMLKTLNEVDSILKERYKEFSASYLDEKTGEIVLEKYTPDMDMEKIKILEDEIKILFPVPVRVEPIKSRLRLDAGPVRGGGALQNRCTTGFAVKRKGGNSLLGVTTAAHCGRSVGEAFTDANGNSQPLRRQYGAHDSSKDIQGYTPALIGRRSLVLPEFYGESKYTAMKLKGKVAKDKLMGKKICHMGRVTGYSCGIVAATEYGPHFDDYKCGPASNPVVCAQTWIAVGPLDRKNNTLGCHGGDSGGPWFMGSKAVGTHTASDSDGMRPGECHRAVVMSIDYLDDLDLELLYSK